VSERGLAAKMVWVVTSGDQELTGNLGAYPEYRPGALLCRSTMGNCRDCAGDCRRVAFSMASRD
jgi:hypothetical protein